MCMNSYDKRECFYVTIVSIRIEILLSYNTACGDVFHPKHGMNKNYSDWKTPVNNHALVSSLVSLKTSDRLLDKYVQQKVEKGIEVYFSWK